jgi:NSS family neurotransmitter:Na+ symporter
MGCFVNMRGLQAGLERVTKVMMILLIIIMMILAVNSVFLPGAAEGIRYLLIPDFKRMQEAGIWNVISAAMNQSFFTLSVGIGSMAIFGSYIGRERALFGESVNVVLLDTFVAICSGLIIIPACFAYGVEAGAGPSLIFITLPNIFNNMPLGRVWGSLFFVFMSFAAFSTVLAVFENIMAMCMDLFGCSRFKSGLFNIFAIFIGSLPCALGFNVLSWIQPRGEGSAILDLEDFIVSNFLLPLGALVFVLFCTRKFGWGWENFRNEADEGEGVKLPEWTRPYITWVLPILIIIVFIKGLI